MLLQLFLIVATLLQPLQAGKNEDGKKALDEILQVSKDWKVRQSSGTIQFDLTMTLSGETSGVVGDLRGVATVKYKKKEVKVKVEVALTKGQFLFITRYPALKVTLVGSMTSMDQAHMPLNEKIRQRETLILKKSKLCPKSGKFGTQCMQPAGK